VKRRVMSSRRRPYLTALAFLVAGLAGGACDSGPRAVPPETRTVPPSAAPAPPSGPPPESPPPEPHRGVAEPEPVSPREPQGADLEASPARALYEDAERALLREEPEHAVTLLQQAVALDPQHHPAWTALFDLLRGGDDPGAAAAACAGLLEARRGMTGHEAATRNLQCALAHRDAQRLEQAEVYAREAVAQGGGRLEPLVTLSGILLERGEAQAVVELLSERVRTVGGPQEAAALTNLGTALLRLERVEEAIATYQNAVALDPTRGDALLGLHDALVAAGRAEEAAAALEQAGALMPEHPAVLSRRHANGAP
jgi:tetratricopeptide (TPR) repeat protein